MPQGKTEFESPERIAVVGTYLPRRCGIATFTTDLCDAMASEAPDANVAAIVINDIPQGYDYPPAVRFEISENILRDYRLAADFLNMNRFDCVCVQHEYGIFGGDAGSHVLALLRGLRMPIITTLHTILLEPSDDQRLVMRELAALSDRLVVMSNRGAAFLKEIYSVPESKITFLHHGIPDVPFVDPDYYKDQFGVEGRKVILTFGLLSPGKGIEHMIEALPAVVEKYPEVVYIVLGATHPHVKRTSGGEYRMSLQNRTIDLGLQDHVLFHNRFVESNELCKFLGAADVCVTPYINEAQIVSGTLAYALGSGKAVVSTPYWYAQDMLAGQRGRLVPFRSAESLASECIYLFDNELERHAMRKRAYLFCREMVWKEVARRYLSLFADVKGEQQRKPRPLYRAHTFEPWERELPEINLAHLRLLTDDTGMLQHARFTVPDRDHGYCTDDNARALVVVLMASRLLPDDPSLGILAARYLSFLEYAFNEENGRFRNFMTYDRKWKEAVGSEDSHGRSVWGLGTAVALGYSSGHAGVAMELFHEALPVLEGFSSPRSRAFALIGIHRYLERFLGDSEARRVLEILARRLYNSFREHATDDWPWPEESLSYANAKLPHALTLGGRRLKKPRMTEMGLRSLDWLVRIQTGRDGCFSPVGTGGWYRRGGTRARFDQQPVEAHAMLDACMQAHKLTGDERWLGEARRCFDWFLGRNDLHLPLYDYASGGCRDGLHPDRVNENQGAESTLVWLLSLLTMYWHSADIPLARARQSLSNEAAKGAAAAPRKSGSDPASR